MTNTRPGAVDWTGDNPFVYLKTDPAGDWSALALYFRIAMSPHGAGQAMLVLEAPYQAEQAQARRLMLTDNPAMARYLLDGFVKHFALFRPCTALLNGMRIVGQAQFSCQDEGSQRHSQRATQAQEGLSLEMHWEELQTPFMAVVPADKTQTGVHEMFSVFRPAASGWIAVNGQRLPGATVERDFFGRRAASAALAFSETWVRAGDGQA
ncbi:NAD-dependent dehydratase [Comamonadaceae bacterium OH2545_COT-014]|nr:NAD-dependent dehydratase [Comamonadaceae bacterium OH2545_COT-014]